MGRFEQVLESGILRFPFESLEKQNPPPGALLGRAGDFWWTSLSMADILVDIVLAHPELPTQCRCLNQANETEMLPAVEHDRFV